MKEKLTVIQKIRELLILIRIQQVGTSVTPIIGALSVKGAMLNITDAFLLFLIAMIINIGGQVHNDLCDLPIDKQSKELHQRPLVKGTISIKQAKTIILFNLILVLIVLLYFYPSLYAIPTILIGFGFGTLYNIYSKKLPGADLFLSISMALFFLFGAIIVTENFQGFQDITSTTWILFILIFIHVFLMDALGGGLKDADNDRKAGAKTLAVYLGIKANKTLYIPTSYKAIILLFESGTLLLTAFLYLWIERSYHIIQLIFIVILLIGMVTATIRLLSITVFDREKIKYINRNHELFGYLLVPTILVNTTGIYWFVFLITLPILWFIIFNYLLYRDSWRKPKTF